MDVLNARAVCEKYFPYVFAWMYVEVGQCLLSN